MAPTKAAWMDGSSSHIDVGNNHFVSSSSLLSPSSFLRVAVRPQILKCVPIQPADDAYVKARPPRRHGSKRRYGSDEHATVYINPSSQLRREKALPSPSGCTDLESCLNASLLSTGDGVTCRLIHKICSGHKSNVCNNNDDILWAPVVLKRLPLHCSPVAPCASDTDKSDSSTIDVENNKNVNKCNTCKINDEDQLPTLYIPPCLAATLGLHNIFHPHHRPPSTIVYLEPLPTTEITNASHATLREIGCPPPIPILKWPSDSSSISSSGGRSGNEEKQLRKFFMYPSTSTTTAGIQASRQPMGDTEHNMNTNRRSTSKPSKSKPRQRLLTFGSILAVPSYEKEMNDDNCCEIEENVSTVDGDENIDSRIQSVRFYQVMDIQSSSQNDGGGTIRNPMMDGDDSGQNLPRNMLAYIISPSTHLVLLPPPSATTDIGDDTDSKSTLNAMTLHPQLQDGTMMMHNYTWRLPRPTMVMSFLRSVSLKLAKLPIATECMDESNTTPSITNGIHHPSAQVLADALYLQGTLSAPMRSTVQRQCHVCHKLLESASSSARHFDSDPCIIHIIGKEKNHVRACVDEAADIMGMRSFHVEGLAAFWAHYNLLNTYSQSNDDNASFTPQLTGALPDKLRGLSAALDIARRSSPCVLHVVDVDHELSFTEGHAADLDARKDEEQRMLEAMRAGCSGSFPHSTTPHDSSSLGGYGRIMTTPQVIVVLSTSRPLPPGPLSSSLLQSSIEISAPDINYARILWDNDADGTFEFLSSYLIGLSAREIIYLRENFSPRWKEDGQQEQSSPVDILQSLLPQLDTMRSFMQSSGRKGSSSTLPLSTSSIPNVRWEDIGGLESIRKEIMDAVELPLKYPHYFEGSRRSGILLFGPPGTGKTLVAKAVARECGLPFLSIKGPELLGSYVGESEANIRAVFDAARSASMTPLSTSLEGGMSVGGTNAGYSGASILFFDEIDSLAPRRGNTGHGDGVMDRVVATLLSELDGSGGSGGGGHGKRESGSAHVVVIGATNRPDLLDPSLLRPGRFDRLLYLGPAKTKEHCLKILMAQTRKFRFEEGCSADTVLERAMESFPSTLSGADLSAVASGALMQGLKRVCDRIEEEARSINLDKGVDEGSEMAVDIDDVMEAWPAEKLQPVLTADDFVEAAKKIIPSISSVDLERFEELQRQFSSGQFI